MAKRTESEWREIAEQYQSCALTQNQRCKQNGINLYTVHDSIKKPKKKAMPTTHETEQYHESDQTSETEPIKWMPITQINKVKSIEQTQLEVRVGNFAIFVPQKFHMETFTEVCKTLKSLC